MERDVEKGCSEKEIEKEQDKKNISLKLYIGRGGEPATHPNVLAGPCLVL